jgi:hypothetical protein
MALCVAGCSTMDLPPVVAETEHFRYRVHTGVPICATALEWLELQYAVVSDWFGASLREGRKFDYVHVQELGEMASYCGVSAGGCAGDGMAFAFDNYNAHEVTHLVADLVGDPPALFREGIAEVLGCNPMVSAVPVRASTELMQLLEDQAFRAHDDPHQAYRWAAGFTRFLLDRHGQEAFLRFYREAPRRGSSARIADTFEAVFGEPLPFAVHAWAEAPPQTYRNVCMHLAECAAPPLPDGAGDEASFGCGIGHGTAPRVLVRTVDAMGGAGLRLAMDGDAPTRVDLFPCDAPADEALEHGRRPPGPGEVWAPLAPGRHWVRIADADFGHQTRGAIPMHLAATVEPSLLTPEPEDAAPQSIPVATEGLLLRGRLWERAMHDDPHRMTLRFGLDAPRRVGVRGFARPGGDDNGNGAAFDGDRVRLCEGLESVTCETATISAESDHFFQQAIEPGEDRWLAVEGTPTDDGVMVELRFVAP